MVATIIQPGEIQPPAGEAPFLRLPERNTLFSQRAERLNTLAQGHAMAGYLLFMGKLAQAQQHALNSHSPVPIPDGSRLTLCREHGMPPLSVQDWPRDPSWQAVLKKIIREIEPDAPPATRHTIERLNKADSGALESCAQDILAGNFARLDVAAAPLVAAALQVYWTYMSTSLGARAFGRNDPPYLCPVCASPPVASVIRIGQEQGLRYLHCSLCATEWNMVRIKCSNCENTKGIVYYSIEGTSGAVKAETCDACGSYLKIMVMEKDPYVDPVADDLASLALDILMDGHGLVRSGPNLFVVSSSG